MGWSLSYQSPRDPALVDATLLAAGKALYLANMFEMKCSYILTMANLEAIIKDDPILSLTEAVAALPKEKMLGATLQDIWKSSLGLTDDARITLDKARQARNFIAHRGASFGELWAAQQDVISEHLVKLHNAVNDLTRGDNIVSGWVYQLEEKASIPRIFACGYQKMVEEWVFGHIREIP